MHLVVAVNPNSAFGRNRGVGDMVANALETAGHRVTAVQRGSFAELEAATREILGAGADALIVVGGDGMVSLGVNALAQSTMPLGIVAAGTGNDMARGLGLPYRSPSESLTVLLAQLASPVRTIDLARVRTANGVERWFGCVLSAGFDAFVNERANQMRRPRGASRYVVALLLELAQLRPRRYRLTVDGDRREVSAVLIAVANNSSLGGGMRIAPQARLNDGRLDIMIGHAMSRLGLLRLLPRVFRGTHLGRPRVEALTGSIIEIDTDGVVAYADGERVGPLPARIEVVPNALRVFAPAASTEFGAPAGTVA